MKIGDADIEDQIFSITKALLVRYGVRGWNMDDLARESSMSKRTLYKIIGTKEELLYKCYENNFVANYTQLCNHLNKEADYVAILDDLSGQLSSHIDEFIIAGSMTIKNEYPRIKELIINRVQKQRNLLVDFFSKGQREGVLKETIAVGSILHMINALMEYHIAHSKDKSEFEKDIQLELQFIFKGLIA